MKSCLFILLLLCPLIPAQNKSGEQKKKPTLEELVKAWDEVRKEGYSKRYYHVMKIAGIANDKSVAFFEKGLSSEKNRSCRNLYILGLSRTPEHPRAASLLRGIARNPKRIGDCRYALSYLRLVDPEWRGVLKSYVDHKNQSLSTSALNALAASRDPESFAVLRSIYRRKNKSPQLERNVVRAALWNFADKKCFDTFARPNLEMGANPPLRQLALESLSRNKDRRFFKFARSHARKVSDDVSLHNWVRWAAVFDSVEAAKFGILLLDDNGKRPRTERAFINAMSGMKSDEVADWVRESAYKSKRLPVRLLAIASMKANPREGDTALLIRLSSESDERLALDAIAALSAHDDSLAVRRLKRLVGHKNPFVAAHALKARFDQLKGAEAVIEECKKIAGSSRSWEMRVAAIELLRNKHAVSARGVLTRNARNKSPHVRSAAYDALTWVRDKDTVDFLLERLQREKGRVLFDLADALADLTGFTWGVKHERWMKWWTRVRDEYPLPPKPKKIKSRSDDGYAGYYGISVNSHRVAFVVDISGSMGARVRTSTRLEEAKSNLISAIKGFSVDVRFNVIAFDNTISGWAEELTRATVANKKLAVDWTKELKPRGGTFIYDALVAAMELDGVDTIFFLSDGAPSGGKVTDTEDILRHIRKQNRFKRIRINTIGVKLTGNMKAFMEKLAEENFGECRIVD